MNKLVIYGLAGVLALASVTGNFVQARTIGALKADAKTQATSLKQCRELHDDAAQQLKDYQNGNVEERTESAARCRADAAAAYDAGRLRDNQSVAERQAAGAYVPGQRVGGGNR